MPSQVCTTDGLAPVIPAFVAAGAAILVACASLYFQWRIRKADEASRRDDRKIGILLKKLDVYAKILGLLGTNERIRATIKRSDGQPFRLVHNVREVKASGSDMDRKNVRRILDINQQIADLIETNGSLIPHPRPESFAVFLQHQRGLEDLWETNSNATPDDVPVYPRQFNVDIANAVERTSSDLQSLGVETEGSPVSVARS